MTYSTQTSTATPSWIDCFATDDGRIVVVGGSFQVLVYNIASSSWSDTNTPSSSLQYGPYVQSSMFLNPVYIQSRILADGYTALVVCTLTWNSQPQPYYLDTNTWKVTLAIGTDDTTPPSSSGSFNGWGVVPGGGTLLPPAGFRQFTLAILGQDKSQAKNHYGNGQAYIIGGYSTLVTGQVSDWATITSFPVQQAPSKTVVMFGNVGSLTKVTRGSAAFPVSRTSLDIFPGNGGGSATEQDVEVYDSGQNAVTMHSGLTGGPGNTVFRGAALIGQGQQIFVHGGLKSLQVSSNTPTLDNLDGSVGVWNGGSLQWGDTANIYVPPKSKGLMIGLIVGGIVLVALIGVGVWRFKKWRKMRLLEEEEQQAKGMVLKNEDQLQKEHKASQQNNNGSGSPPAAHGAVLYHNQMGMVSAEAGTYDPLLQKRYGYVEAQPAHSLDLRRQDVYQGLVEYPYAEAELIDEETVMKPRAPNNPQEYPTNGVNNGAMYGDITRVPSHYQTVVSVPGHPVYGKEGQAVLDVPQLTQDFQNLKNLRASQDGISRASLDPMPMQSVQPPPSSTDIRSSLYSQAISAGRGAAAVAAQDSFNGVRPYSSTSSASFIPHSANQASPHMSSPTFSATYSVPDSMQGSEATHYSLVRTDPSAADLMDRNVHTYHP
ncbi:hypothetical protein BGZ80_004538 [Entomortierella chlamydospora]|uniref:Uncharacterized protein n=1 Tax=Entomortierella chlamydospora TaxID=101097 RepID=A0A9P6N0M3_9FUNG|nr:hypothetical protein BGZ80_004538 [Entomortierella chlamydospora]